MPPEIALELLKAANYLDTERRSWDGRASDGPVFGTSDATQKS